MTRQQDSGLGCLIWLVLIALSVGLGFFYGAGWGWITFAVICGLLVVASAL